MSPKERYQAITYCETLAVAVETLEDEIEAFQTKDQYSIDRSILNPSVSSATLEDDFMEIVNACRDECLYRRGQWLIPKFAGVTRTKRRRTTEQIECTRTANIQNQAQLDSYVASGMERLARLNESIPVSVMSAVAPMPLAQVRPCDQPKRPNNPGVLLQSISREARLTKPPAENIFPFV